MPTLFMFSLEKVNQCWHSSTQQFIKRIDDDSEECSILKNWTKIVPALFTLWPSRVFQDFENTSGLSHGVSYLVSLCKVYFLQFLQNLFTSSRVGLGVLLTLIE